VEANLVVIELKPDSQQRVEEWAEFIRSNLEEALLTLKNEGVTIENYFLVNIDSKDYLIGYMRARSLQRATQTVKDSLSEIDAIHQQFKTECWGKRFQGKSILELSRIENEEKFA